MILLWGALLGVVVGWLRGGRLRALEKLQLRAGWLVLGAILLQILIFPVAGADPLLPQVTVPLHFLSYTLLALFLILNRGCRPLLLVGLGLALNLLVIAANGGYMPASPQALLRAGKEEVALVLQEKGRLGNVVRMGEETHLNFLGDFLYVPGWVPLATAFSPGDVAIALGLVWFFPAAMGKRSAEEKGPARG